MEKYEKNHDGIVINKDIDNFHQYRMLRNKSIREKDIKSRIEYLEQENLEIKKILAELQDRIG